MKARSRKNAGKSVIKEGKFLRFVKRDDWEYFERHNCSGIVIIVPVTSDGKVIFVQQFRPPVKRSVIEFPAGLVNDIQTKSKESLITAAKRELLEETGYKSKKMIKLLRGPVSGGASGDILTMLYATGLEKVASGGGDDFESIIVHEVPLEETEKWLKKMQRHHLIEPKIYAGLYFLHKCPSLHKT